MSAATRQPGPSRSGRRCGVSTSRMPRSGIRSRTAVSSSSADGGRSLLALAALQYRAAPGDDTRLAEQTGSSSGTSAPRPLGVDLADPAAAVVPGATRGAGPNRSGPPRPAPAATTGLPRAGRPRTGRCAPCGRATGRRPRRAGSDRPAPLRTSEHRPARTGRDVDRAHRSRRSRRSRIRGELGVPVRTCRPGRFATRRPGRDDVRDRVDDLPRRRTAGRRDPRPHGTAGHTSTRPCTPSALSASGSALCCRPASLPCRSCSLPSASLGLPCAFAPNLRGPLPSEHPSGPGRA